MSKRLVFPSIEHPNRRYTWWESYYDAPMYMHSGGRFSLDDHAGQFETYGDNGVQHSGECVVSRDLWIDYLTSLGAFLVENPPEAEVLFCHWPDAKSVPRIRFAIDLKYVEGKRRYYNLDELKVSSSDSKRHDKRWESVEPWHDGTLTSAYRVLVREWNGMLERFSILSAIMDEANRDSHRYWWGDAFKLLGFEKSDEDYAASHMHAAYQIVDYAVKSWRYLDMSRRQLGCQKHNWVHNTLGREVVS